MTAQHQERHNESFVIEIRGADKVEQLVIKEFQSDFQLMATHLRVMNRRMVLLNPVSKKALMRVAVHQARERPAAIAAAGSAASARSRGPNHHGAETRSLPARASRVDTPQQA